MKSALVKREREDKYKERLNWRSGTFSRKKLCYINSVVSVRLGVVLQAYQVHRTNISSQYLSKALEIMI